MSMLLTTIVLFIAFGILAVGIGRLLVKMFPPSAEDIKRFKFQKSESVFDDNWGTSATNFSASYFDSGPGVNISNDIDGGIWGH